MSPTIPESKRWRVLIGSALPLLLVGSLLTDPSLAAERPDFSTQSQLDSGLIALVVSGAPILLGLVAAAYLALLFSWQRNPRAPSTGDDAS